MKIQFLIIILILISSCSNLEQQTTTKQTDYYGKSLGSCKTNEDCIISGCNSEICQSKSQERLVSTCILPEKPTLKQLGYLCLCINNKCQWD